MTFAKMKSNESEFEAQASAILEQMEIAATCSECGNVSLAIWGSTERCPHCDGKSQAVGLDVGGTYNTGKNREVASCMTNAPANL